MINLVFNGICPSLNQCYATNFKTGRRFPSKALGEFKKEFKKLSPPHSGEISAIQGKRLCLIIEMWMKRERIYCKNGKIKKMDVSNRIKPLEDAISDLIGIDDSQFFRVVAVKKETDLKERTEVFIMEER